MLTLLPFLQFIGLRGGGFFSDAYDLSIANVLNQFLKHAYPCEGNLSGLNCYSSDTKTQVSNMVFAGAVCGQLTLGILSDTLGRKLSAIVSCCFLIVGAVFSAFAGGIGPAVSVPSLMMQLMVARFLLGVGIGGEYPTSATTAAEASTFENRGRNVLLVFSMQAVGFFTAALAGFLIISGVVGTASSYSVSELNTMWRLALGLGAIPPLLLFWPRLREAGKEGEEKALVQKRQEQQKRNGTALAATTSSCVDDSLTGHDSPLSVVFILRHYGRQLAGTAGSWFLFDVVFYANTIFSDEILAGRNSLHEIAKMNVVLGALMLPGYLAAAFTVNRIGRRNLQLIGFLMMAVVYAVMGGRYEAIDRSAHRNTAFVALFAVQYFFANWGPNATTFLLPAESYPTRIRATCHGFSAAMGKVGAYVGGVCFVAVRDSKASWGGSATVFYCCAGVSLLGFIVTLVFIDDKHARGITLKDLDDELEGRLAAERAAKANSEQTLCGSLIKAGNVTQIATV